MHRACALWGVSWLLLPRQIELGRARREDLSLLPPSCSTPKVHQCQSPRQIVGFIPVDFRFLYGFVIVVNGLFRTKHLLS